MGLCASEQVPVNPDRIDESHFEMWKVVGRGGFGKVNAVVNRTTGELLAMKRMSKSVVVEKETNIRMVWVERNIMRQLNSPFHVNCIHAFQNDRELFLIMPFMRGGDLRYHMKEKSAMNERAAQFYAAEVLLALEDLHALHIVYRDLKPENVLLDAEGHIRLSDFGISVQLREDQGFMTHGRAGTPGYLAPEVSNNQRYGTSADIWTYGILIYELLHGSRPFRHRHTVSDYSETPDFSRDLSPEMRDLLTGLLKVDPAQRLGCGPDGLESIKRHPWFAGFDWGRARERKLDPPIKPDPDRANCSGDLELEEQFLEAVPQPVGPVGDRNFEGFEFNILLFNGKPVSPAASGALEEARKKTAAAAAAGGGRGGGAGQRPSEPLIGSDKELTDLPPTSFGAKADIPADHSTILSPGPLSPVSFLDSAPKQRDPTDGKGEKESDSEKLFDGSGAEAAKVRE